MPETPNVVYDANGNPITVSSTAQDYSDVTSFSHAINTADWDALIGEQRAYNKKFQAGSGVEGIVSGRTRYAPVVQGGIMQGVVNEGLQKIADLVSKKTNFINQAMEANRKADFEELNLRMKAKADAEKAIKDEAYRISEEARKVAKEERDAEKFKREEAEAMAENLVPSIMGQFGDDDEENAKTLSKIALESKIDPNILIKKISDYTTAQTKEKNALLTSDIKEYEYAKKAGTFKGSYKDWKIFDANLKFKADPGVKLSAEAEQVVDLYGDMVVESILEGESPYEAVRMVTTLLAQEMGQKLSFNAQQALLMLAISAQLGSGQSGVQGESPLPGETENYGLKIPKQSNAFSGTGVKKKSEKELYKEAAQKEASSLLKGSKFGI